MLQETKAKGKWTQRFAKMFMAFEDVLATSKSRFLGRMDDDVVFCPNTLASFLPGLPPTVYAGYDSPRKILGQKIVFDAQFSIFGRALVQTMLASSAYDPNDSQLLFKLIAEVYGRNSSLLYAMPLGPSGKNISVHTGGSARGKGCLKSFYECEYAFQSLSEFCQRGMLSFHRFRDLDGAVPGTLLRAQFGPQVCEQLNFSSSAQEAIGVGSKIKSNL